MVWLTSRQHDWQPSICIYAPNRQMLFLRISDAWKDFYCCSVSSYVLIVAIKFPVQLHEPRWSHHGFLRNALRRSSAERYLAQISSTTDPCLFLAPYTKHWNYTYVEPESINTSIDSCTILGALAELQWHFGGLFCRLYCVEHVSVQSIHTVASTGANNVASSLFGVSISQLAVYLLNRREDPQWLKA